LTLYLLFFFVIPPPPSSTLFPYTTLFRSGAWRPHLSLVGQGLTTAGLGRLAQPVGVGGALRSGLEHVAAGGGEVRAPLTATTAQDRKSTRLNSSHLVISYAVFCLKKKKKY